MEKIFHWTNTFKTLGEDEDGSVDIKGLASTNAVDRAGDVINHDAWVKQNGLENYKTNPIVLFNHDYNKPIGRATSLNIVEHGIDYTSAPTYSFPRYAVLKSVSGTISDTETFTSTSNPIFLVHMYPSDYSMIFIEFDQSQSALICRGVCEGYKFTREYGPYYYQKISIVNVFTLLLLSGHFDIRYE